MEFMDLIETPRVDNVKYCRQVFDEELNQLSNQFQDGSLCLTSHHLIFSPKNKTKDQEIWILHCSIDLLEQKIRETKFQIIIKLKDFQIFIVEFPSLYFCQSIFKSLEALSNISSDNMKLPFFYQIDFKMDGIDGWNLYSIEAEFNKYFNNNPCEWRISEVNKDYSFCSTYPKKVIVPKTADDNMLIKSSQFRALGRFPVLSYYHNLTKSFMMRCSQPLLGSNNKRCKEDETLLKNSLPMGKKGYIFDLRDTASMKTIISKGGGYETEAHYPLWKRINKNIEKYDQLNASFSKLIDSCCGDFTSTVNASNVEKWLNKLEGSGWLSITRNVLHTACAIADELHNKNGCVLVHGNEGTDNTLLITSLVKILLNPECRTINGFQNLIESEWLQAGHPFSKRCFKLAYGSSTQSGPVFLLFLDCVRQLIDQFCISFEFNEEFLIFLFDNINASKFGTFLGNSERERENLFLSNRTISLWSYVNSSENIKKFLNPLYEANNTALWPSIHFQSLSVWLSLFLRYQRNENPLKEAKVEMTKLIETNNQSRMKVSKLKNELIELQKEAQSLGILTN